MGSIGRVDYLNGEVKLSFKGGGCKWNREIDVADVVKKIESAEHVDVLELTGNSIGVDAGNRIAESLKLHPELKRALWSDIFTGRSTNEIPIVLESLRISMLSTPIYLVELDLSDNAFGQVCVEAIKTYLENAYTLEILKFDNNGLGNGGKIIAEALIACHQNAYKCGRKFRLKLFSAGRNRLTNFGAIHLAKAFRVLQTLEEISLHQNSIDSGGIFELADSFESNPNLKSINLADNTFLELGSLKMSRTLLILKKLERIEFSDCMCRSHGVLEMVRTLPESIKYVDFSGNEILAKHVDEILHIIFAGSRRPVVIMRANKFGEVFSDIKERWGEYDSLDLGEESDDEGTESDFRSPSPSISESASDTEDPHILKSSLEDAENLSDIENEEKPTIKVSFRDEQNVWETEKDVQLAVQRIECEHNLEILELKGNTLSRQAGACIAKAVRHQSNLKRALWSDLFTGRLLAEIPPTLDSLFSSLISSGCHLKELDLSDNAFGQIGAEALRTFLSGPSACFLEIIRLNNNGLGRGGEVIAMSLEKCYMEMRANNEKCRLKVFVAGRNRLEDNGALAFARTFQIIDSLEQIELPQNGIKSQGITALVNSFQNNPNLKVIDLSDNTFNIPGAKAFAKVLPSLVNLKKLNLSDCLCRNEGALAILSSFDMSLHFRIKEINLSGNELSAKTLETIIRTVDSSKFHLSSLILHTNNAGGSFREIKEYGRKFNFIDLGCESDDQGSEDECDMAEDSDQSSNFEQSLIEGIDRLMVNNVAKQEESEESVQQNLKLDLDFIRNFCTNPNSEDLEVLSARKSDVVSLLQEDIHGPLNLITGNILYALCLFFDEINCKRDCDRSHADDLAAAILGEVSVQFRQPLTAMEQVCNNILAYAGFIRSEEVERMRCSHYALNNFFIAQLERGFFISMEKTIDYFLSWKMSFDK